MEKINLLIVDDEVDFLNSITKSLEVRGFNVIAVTRGEKAIEAAKKNALDIALVDLKMPGMNGEETLQALKKEHKWMEIVILTGHGTIDSAVECTKIGAYSFLQKPCELDELLATLKSAYKKVLMNREDMDEEKIDEMIELQTKTPREILKQQKEKDNS
ncbi:MAG: response regulator [Desulfobacteraceae bacterium]|nr:response regulator [Desulfobacteraceae bacterium]